MAQDQLKSYGMATVFKVYVVNIQIWINFLQADMTKKETSKQETSTYM